MVRIERSSEGNGPPDIFETYDTTSGKSVLIKREEDSNGDGSIDVTSLYEDGKLVQREDVSPQILNTAKGEIRSQYLSSEKARRQLDWKPTFALQEGLTETIQWYREFFG